MTDRNVATLMYKPESPYLLLLCVISPHLPLRHLGFLFPLLNPAEYEVLYAHVFIEVKVF